MKLLLIVVALFGVAYCAPVSDETILEHIDEVINHLTESLDFKHKLKGRDYFEGYVLKAVRHIDRQCILKSVKKYDSIDKIPTTKFQKTHSHKELDTAYLSFIATLGSCYKKGDVILEYFFESWMTNGILIRAFINEKAFSKYADTIACINFYAVKNHYWEPKNYGFTLKAVEDEDLCDEMTAAIDMVWIQESKKFYTQKFADEHNKKCYRGVSQKVKAFIVRYVTLLQLELTDAQRSIEKQNFIKDVYDLFEDLKMCGAIEA